MGMQTFNFGFFTEGRNGRGQPSYSGYGIDSIQDFANNLNYLLDGASVRDLTGTYADGNDGLEATKIALAVHESVEAGGAVIGIS